MMMIIISSSSIISIIIMNIVIICVVLRPEMWLPCSIPFKILKPINTVWLA